ncbi:O-antigen ligase family protein [Pseudoalteromonas shioyasakiensis]|uniref:O-antigen ligase family protein n=1 Tax=Pseudoalteromonas shioyasakiensis TaxID=1190813 RepID=UPI0022B0F8B2|nr:O-antigen ligase family protein [Pseudoalteromonas shioyasakiensis]MCZ4253331.1 O-antigen ligase family protein [Pseudoalteromonas shioyasakiensis]
MSRIVFALLCVTVFLLPLPLGSYRPWAILSIGLLVNFTFLVHLFNGLKNNSNIYPPKYSYFLLATLLFVIIILLYQKFTVSIDPFQTTQMLLKTQVILVFSWLLFIYCNNANRIRTLLLVIVSAGVFQSLYASYLNFTPDISSPIFGYAHTERAIGTFTYSNFLANYLGLCLALGVGLLVSELKRSSADTKLTLKKILRGFSETMLSQKVILRLSLIIIIVGLILTRSRMGNSAFFIALIIVSALALIFYKKKPRSFKILIVSFFILDLIIIGAIFDVEKVKQRLSETSLQSETRDEVVRDSIPLILEKPFLGSGGGTFYTAFPRFQSEPYSGYYDNAHNDYIQFTVELGLIGTIPLAILVIYCLLLCFKTMKNRKTALYQGIAFGCAIAITMMLLHSSVDYSLQAGANSMYFILILCLSIITNKLPRNEHTFKPRHNY